MISRGLASRNSQAVSICGIATGASRMRLPKARQRAFRRLAELVAIGHLRQAQQVHHRHRVAGGLGAIVIFFHPQDQPVIVRRRAEEPALIRCLRTAPAVSP